jgi:hypothetical protein
VPLADAIANIVISLFENGHINFDPQEDLDKENNIEVITSKINPNWQTVADEYPISEYPKFWEEDGSNFDI